MARDDSHPPLDPHERARIEQALDRIEERLATSGRGFYNADTPADAAATQAESLPEAAALVWQRFGAIDLASGEARMLPLTEISVATRDAGAEGLLREGDLVVAERGRETFVLPGDPWVEGADVVRVSEEAERAPEASSLAHLVLGWMGELTVLFSEDGEFREDLLDDAGEFTEATTRKLLRRRLDFDTDAPRPRLDLVEVLLGAGELRAARKELKIVFRCAPEYARARFIQGRLELVDGKPDLATTAFGRAAELTADEVWRGHFLAHAAASTSDSAKKTAFAEQVLALRPEFAAHQVLGAAAQLERGDVANAQELLRLGLAVAPRNLELLELRRRCAKSE